MQLLIFAWRKQGNYLLVYFLTLAMIAAAIYFAGLPAVVIAADWWGKVGTLAGVAAFGAAFLVWLTELQQDWEQSLPKRLDVHFYLVQGDGNCEVIMACLDATLAGESDIRQMSQQVGAQMNGSRNLTFAPQFEILAPEVDRQQNVRRYVAQMYLSSMPEAIKQLAAEAGQTGLLRHEVNGTWKDDAVSDLSARIREARQPEALER